jgi:hypothetical protein
MKSWQVFKDSLPIYLCQSPKSFYMEEEGIIIAKSGVNSVHCNFAIIEKGNSEKQKEIISKYFDCDGIIFSLKENRVAIDKWINSLGFKSYVTIPLMNKQQEQIYLLPKFYDNIKIERVFNGKEYYDFINIFAETRNISLENAKEMFLNNLPPSIYFNYVAYYLGEPAGIFIAINTKNGAIIADADVKKEFQNSGILKILSQKAFYDVVDNNILNYSVLPTSQFAYNVIMEYGFFIEQYCYSWKKVSGGEING